MSGGYFRYIDRDLKHEIFGYSGRGIENAFEDIEISHLVWDVLELMNDYSMYAEGDTDKETYVKAKKAFKDKWFGERSDNVKRIVDIAIDDLRKELYESFDLKE